MNFNLGGALGTSPKLKFIGTISSTQSEMEIMTGLAMNITESCHDILIWVVVLM